MAYRFGQCILAAFLISYLIYQHIEPVAKESLVHFEERNLFEIALSVLSVSIPCSYMWLMMFFGIFHALTNLAAELTCFEDRRFYSNWWNAGNLAEYWRKWNHPIHNWLVRHCYYPLVRRGMDQTTARLLTFAVSAYFHEHIAVGTFRFCNGIAFLFMIVNVPLISL